MMSGGPTGRVALGLAGRPAFATTTLVVLELMRHAWMPYAQPGPFLCLEIDRSTGEGTRFLLLLLSLCCAWWSLAWSLAACW